MPTVTQAPRKAKRLWTYDEVVAELPETNQPTELWDGELIMSPAPHPKHQETVLLIARLLQDFVSHRKLGKVLISPIDVVLSPRRTVQPDVIFVHRDHLQIVQAAVRGAPDLIVEVLSTGNWRRDRIDKKSLYEQYDVPEYWIVDLEARTIEVFTLAAGAYRLHCKAAGNQSATSKLLEGFTLTFSKIEAR